MARIVKYENTEGEITFFLTHLKDFQGSKDCKLGETHIAALCFCLDNVFGPTIFSFAVCKEERGKGYGIQLIEECKKYVLENNYSTLYVQDDSDNRDNLENNIYIKCGFKVIFSDEGYRRKMIQFDK
jgi:GNAT superfamily N-acetyltransferase